MSDCKRCDECGAVEPVTEWDPDGGTELPDGWEYRERRDPLRYVDLCPKCVERVGPRPQRPVASHDSELGEALRDRYLREAGDAYVRCVEHYARAVHALVGDTLRAAEEKEKATGGDGT